MERNGKTHREKYNWMESLYSLHWFITQMPAMIVTGPHQSREPVTQSESLKEVAGTQLREPSSASSQSVCQKPLSATEVEPEPRHFEMGCGYLTIGLTSRPNACPVKPYFRTLKC